MQSTNDLTFDIIELIYYKVYSIEGIMLISGRSPDPEFEAKQAAILGLYLNPPENALVLSVDEKTQIQARRLTATYKRNGTTCLLAALAVHDGTVTARTIDRNNHEAFLAFLKRSCTGKIPASTCM